MDKQDPRWEEEIAARRAFVDDMLACTVRLIRVEGTLPAGKGSGVLYSKGERLFLLSVLHVLKRSDWFVETECAEGEKPLLLEVPSVNWVVRAKLDSSTQSLSLGEDGFAWAEFAVPELKAKLALEPRLTGQSVALNAYTGPLDAVPLAEEAYHIVAAPPREYHPALNVLLREPFFELDMTYDGNDARGFYRFRLAGKHRGDDFYRGASGAPIADFAGTIVALVQGGCESEGVIYGVPLALYARVLDLPEPPVPKHEQGVT